MITEKEFVAIAVITLFERTLKYVRNISVKGRFLTRCLNEFDE